MKQLKDYLNEGLLSKKISTKTPIRYKPETKDELKAIIIDLLKKGITNLNCIDVSEITDMEFLFSVVNAKITVKDINISEWDVSNVTNMNGMFYNCNKFTSDLSKWDVSNVKFMAKMFYNCNEFNSDLSEWDVSKVNNMDFMFDYCNEFNSNLSEWDVSKVKTMDSMFDFCDKLEKNNKIPTWYKG